MEHLLHPLLVWLHLHPTWAGVVTFLITFFESLAIVGLFIPGSVTLSAIGGLVGSGVVPAAPIFAWAIFGAILGDGLSFWIGYRYHKVIRNAWPIRRFPKLLTKGERFFEKHGGKGLFLGRFVGPMRPVMPLIAGMLRVSPRKFLMVEMLSGLLWAPVYMLPGIIVGAAAAHFAPHQALRYIGILLAVLFIIWLLFWLSQLIVRLCVNHWNALFDSLWQKTRISAPKIYAFLYEHEHPNSSRPLSVLTFALLFGLIFFLFVICIMSHSTWLINLNMATSAFFQSLHTQPLANAAIFISAIFGKYSVILMTSACLALYLFIRKDVHALFYLIVTIAMAVGCTLLFKHLVHFTRPSLVLNPPVTFSFPSGHTLMGFLFYGYLAFLMAHNNSNSWRKIIYRLTALLVSLIAISRLYLNVHWLSDIVGSILLATCILSFIVLFYRCRERCNRYQNIWLLTLVIIGQAIFGTAYYYKHVNNLRHDTLLKQTRHYVDNVHWWQSKISLLPVYKNNRLGQPSQLLNVQWLSNVATIKASLQQHGWEIAHPLSVKALKSQLMGKDVTIVSPLPEVYQHQKPVLVMVKKTTVKGAYLILHLWKANLAASKDHLYIGSVSYHLPLQHLLWHERSDCSRVFASAIEVFSGTVKKWDVQKILIKSSVDLQQSPCVKVSYEILKLRG